MKDDDKEDPDFSQNSSSRNFQTSRTTRQSLAETSSGAGGKFPFIPIRTGRKKLNPSIMRCIVHIESKYKIGQRDTEGIFVDIARMVFNQPYTNSPDFNDDNLEAGVVEEDAGEDEDTERADEEAGPCQKKESTRRSDI